MEEYQNFTNKLIQGSFLITSFAAQRIKSNVHLEDWGDDGVVDIKGTRLLSCFVFHNIYETKRDCNIDDANSKIQTRQRERDKLSWRFLLVQ